MNDAELIEKSGHEPELFGAIFDRHFDVIARFCVRRLGRARGEDVAGDVFRWAFENRLRFLPAHADARPWLFGIANNLVRESLRSMGRQGLAYDRWLRQGEHDEEELDAHVAAAIDAEHDLFAVAAALELQPTEDVETMLLFAWESLSYVQVAEALSIPVGTVRSRISRVRQHLHDHLGLSAITFDCPKGSPGGSA
jgi:RNA polymerase sigma-70 factor (ECF subfamily)